MVFVQCSFIEHRNYKVIYRRYASLFFLVGIDNGEVSYTAFHLFHVSVMQYAAQYISNMAVWHPPVTQCIPDALFCCLLL